EVFKEEFEVHLKSQDLDGIFSSYEYVSLTESNFNRIKIFFYKECEEQIAVFRTHINKLSKHLKKSDTPEISKQKVETIDTTLNGMLDTFMADIKQRDNIDKDFCNQFKKEFTQQLNDSGLFSSSKFEVLHQQILLL